MNEIILTAEAVEITALADAGRDPAVEIVAYRGGPMRPGGNPSSHPIIVDLAGVDVKSNTPLLTDHNATTDGIIGRARANVKGGELHASGSLSRSATGYAKVIGLHKSGVTFQASIGAEIVGAVDVIHAGRSVTVNGRTFPGPVAVARKTILREISLLPSGADHTTEVHIAARKAKTMPQTETTVENNASGLPAGESEEIARLDAINAAHEQFGNKHPDLMATAMKEKWPASQFKLKLYEVASPKIGIAASKGDQLYATLTSGPHINAGPAFSNVGSGRINAAPTPENIISAGLMIHAGREDAAVKQYGERVTQQAADMRCRSLMDLAAAALHLEHRDVPRSATLLASAGFSTMSLPIALSNLANKSTADAFNVTPGIWDTLARRRTVSDFKDARIVRVLLTGNLLPLAPDGEIKHGGFSETSLTARAATKALMLALTRVDLINDDLGVFNDTAAALGRAAKRTINDDFATTLLNNSAFFTAGNKNIVTGAGMDIDGLTKALLAMSIQKDADGRSIDVRPKYLLVPPALEAQARQLIASQTLNRYVSSTKDNAPQGNPFLNSLEILVEPRLQNTSFTGSSSSTWYLFASPADAAINVALLNGRADPVIETADSDFNTLGVQYRCYIDYGFSLGETVAALKATA